LESSFLSPLQINTKKARNVVQQGVRGAASDADEVDEAVEAVERASKTIDEILREMSDTMFVEVATADVLGEEPELTQSEALRGAIKKRLNDLDASFMAALAAYMRAAEARGDRQLIQILTFVREEVLAALTSKLPPSMQVVDLIVREPTLEQRNRILSTSVGGGDGDKIPSCSPDEIALAVGQLIDEMERMAEVPEWKLLMRLCSAREMVRRMGVEDERSARTTVPPSQAMSAETQMVNNLAMVVDPNRRKSFLRAAFDKSQNSERRQAADKEAAERSFGPQPPKRKSMSDIIVVSGVRPGRFMDGLVGLIRESKAQGSPLSTVKMLEKQYNEACEVLEDLS